MGDQCRGVTRSAANRCRLGLAESKSRFGRLPIGYNTLKLGRTLGLSLLGLDGTPVLVECQISNGLPSISLVGLPDASLGESVSRVRSALASLKIPMPSARVTVNLSPASIPKSGSSYDLAIAAALLSAMGIIREQLLAECFHLGELGLDGSLRPIRGVLAALAAIRKSHPEAWVVIPLQNLAEANLLPGGRVLGASNLNEVIQFFSAAPPTRQIWAERAVASLQQSNTPEMATSSSVDFCQVLGQPFAVNSLVIAAAGGHNLMMEGPPGAGKTMLAERFPGLLPKLTLQRAIETTAIHSLRFARSNLSPLIDSAPFIAPHHSATMSALVGGGSRQPLPGAISLAHNGVLFLDEAAEFSRGVLDSLRQPLESGSVTVSRAAATVTFPAKFQLIMATNPCACGRFNQLSGGCVCSAQTLSRYHAKLSAPLLDRIDIKLKVQKVGVNVALGEAVPADSTERLAGLVLEARNRAEFRYRTLDWQQNSEAPASWVREHLASQRKVLKPLRDKIIRGEVSMRTFSRVLRVSLTVADMNTHSMPTSDDVAMAMQLNGLNNDSAVFS